MTKDKKSTHTSTIETQFTIILPLSVLWAHLWRFHSINNSISVQMVNTFTMCVFAVNECRWLRGTIRPNYNTKTFQSFYVKSCVQTGDVSAIFCLHSSFSFQLFYTSKFSGFVLNSSFEYRVMDYEFNFNPNLCFKHF